MTSGIGASIHQLPTAPYQYSNQIPMMSRMRPTIVSHEARIDQVFMPLTVARQANGSTAKRGAVAIRPLWDTMAGDSARRIRKTQ